MCAKMSLVFCLLGKNNEAVNNVADNYHNLAFDSANVALIPFTPAPAEQMTAQADSDADVVALWLHGRSPHTVRAYRHDIGRFLAFVARPLRAVRLRDLQAFADSLAGLAPGSQARTLAACKSLLSFGARLGYLQVNVGGALPLPAVRDRLAERILDEESVLHLIRSARSPRDRTLLRLLYCSGIRVSECCGLTWADVRPNTDSGQISVWGKGGKGRAIKLTPACYAALVALRDGAADDAPVFLSRKHCRLDPSSVARIVRAAARRAGLAGRISPHWFRHAHASHALDRGAPVHLVQSTLGHASLATTSRYVHARPGESSSKYLAA